MTETSSPPILDVKNLSVTFKSTGGAEYRAVRDVNFTIRKGETLALVGESGSGKSVTALSLMQLLPYPNAQHPAGSSIVFQGQELVGAPDSIMRHVRGDKISMIFQEPMTSLNPLHTIGRQIGEVLRFHKRMDDKVVLTRTLELLEMVELDALKTRLNAYPHELSGGQRQRVMIAIALANNPDVLIADEPTTALDVTVQAQIMALLAQLQAKLGMAILLITHDLNVVRACAHRVCVMKNGEIVEQGNVAEVFAAPAHPYTRLLLAAEPKGAPASVAATAPVVVEGRDVKVHFPVKGGFFRRTTGYVKAVDGIDLAVKRGETLGIVGESGSGKTTLALALLRLTRSTGRIVFQSKDISSLSGGDLRPLRRHLQVVFQDPYGSLSPRMSVGQIIAEGLQVHAGDMDAAARDAAVIDILREVGLDPEARHRYPHEFSGGQRQRISIARALILKPEVIVLDEPTSALDMSVQAQIVELMRDLQARYGITYLFISHDLRVIKAMSHRVMVMRHGKMIEEGDADAVFNAPQTDYTRALIKAAFEIKAA